ncbi:MAG TPA: xanthine dehydrogenase family protein molybdopterin-binding subunit [Caulobacteraceae bacterium]
MTAQFSRRGFVVSAVGGGLLMAIRPALALADAAAPSPPPTTAFIRVPETGPIVLIMPRVEMGQGVYTSLSMLLAEELEVGLDQIAVEAAPPNADLYSDPINGEQVTGTSATTMAWYDPLRNAGATVRTLMITAAAQRFGVPAVECRAERGVVSHPKSRRKATYGSLAKAAAALPVPAAVALKQPADWRLLGKPIPRLDQADKVNGAARFGIDVQLPGMLYATVAACPAFGGTLKSVDEAPALKVAGVIKVVRLRDAVAVIANHTGAAIKGLKALAPEWDLGPGADDNSAAVWAAMEKASASPGVNGVKTGDADAALGAAAKKLDAVYRLPLLAHATMEPINCTVQVKDGGAEVWVGTQAPVRARDAAAKGAGVPPDKVIIHNHLLGGGFGRRLYVDHIGQAAAIARQVSAPVKVIWTREEDIRHDHYRPCYFDRLAAGLDASGRIVAWKHRVAASAVSEQWAAGSLQNGLDSDALDPAAGTYDFANVLTDYVRVEPGQVPTGWWRGVGPTHNIFMVESFMDEMAALAGEDPIAFRLKHLGKAPRAAGVLKAVAEASGWGKPLPAGRGRGVSLIADFGSFLAEVAEVDVAPDGTVRVDKVTCAVDCGKIVNPDTIRAQVMGGITFGLTAALWGEVTLEKGQIKQSNFHDYRPLRMPEAPEVTTVIVESTEAPGGIGEPPCSAVSPAVTNAIFAATAKRIRTLPIGAQLAKA